MSKMLDRLSSVFLGIAGFMICELILGHTIQPTAIVIGAMLAIGIACGAAGRHVTTG